jgi:two-component system cell cycle response regulator DivK
VPARILIIEDNPDSCDLLKYLLESSGYEVLEAVDGGAGVALALRHNPDMVLCDLQLPVLNGYEVIHQLKADARWRPVPLIAVTAFSMLGDREKALAEGFSDHIAKPIDPEAIIAQLEAWLPPALWAERHRSV